MANRTGKLIGLALLGGGLACGFAIAHWQLFPFHQLSALARALGPGEEAPEDGGDGGELPPGLWHRAKSDEAPEMEAMRELADLPYLGAYKPAPDEAGVTLNPAAARDGLNLVVSGHAPHAALLDMDGSLRHEWRLELREAWPELDVTGREGHASFWRRAHAFPNGDLLAIYDGIGMVKLDRASKLLWANPGNYHHDLWLADDGTIYTLSRHERTLEQGHPKLTFEGPIQEDFVSVLSPAGEELRRVSVLDCFVQSDYYPLLAFAKKRGDILHANTIERMDGRFAERHPLYAAGNFLISLPTINTIAVVDIERATVVWALAGMWKFQHQPTVLTDGSMLVFDNLGEYGDSRVLQIDPLTQDVLWSYRGSEDRRFSSYFLGSSERLPGGNTLITESAAGRAFEVDPDGRRVWEYVNPHRGGEGDRLIASLLEVVRVERAHFDAEFTALMKSSTGE